MWMRERPKVCEKIDEIVVDICAHFGAGMGSPEKLGGSKPLWSRWISEKHRIVYRVNTHAQLIDLICCRGHYADNGWPNPTRGKWAPARLLVRTC
jgi:Txe/YoeB family toxin of toxin-antitoxin system